MFIIKDCKIVLLEREREGESRIEREPLGYDICRTLLLRSASTRLAQGLLKTFNHLSFFFVLLSWEIDIEFHFQPVVVWPHLG